MEKIQRPSYSRQKPTLQSSVPVPLGLAILLMLLCDIPHSQTNTYQPEAVSVSFGYAPPIDRRTAALTSAAASCPARRSHWPGKDVPFILIAMQKPIPSSGTRQHTLEVL